MKRVVVPCLLTALSAVALAQPEAAPPPADPADPAAPRSSDPPPNDPAQPPLPAAPTAPDGAPAPTAREPVDVTILPGRPEPVGGTGLEPLHDRSINRLDDAPGMVEQGFKFGSYGRVVAGSDLRGGKPTKLLVVARGPRVVEASYLELDFQYLTYAPFTGTRAIKVRPVVTLAFAGQLFHDTGQFDAQPALRNMFLEADLWRNLTAWAGSRMYRGDDIYLFDTWPLDDQNTVGAGVQYRRAKDVFNGDVLELAVHGGVNRLLDPFTFQQVEVPDPEQGAATVLQLDRQRLVASTTASYVLGGRGLEPSYKLKVHGEVHALPSGTRRREPGDGSLERLPSDRGFLVGAQLGMFRVEQGRDRRDHLNLFARYARGLAAFDELAPPTSLGPNLKTTRASELQLGLSGAYEHAFGNVIVGALARRFVDADGTSADPDDGWEYAIDARPLANLWGAFYGGADISYQARFPRGLNPITLNAEDPAIFQFAPMLVYSPMGRSAYHRPQLRLLYRAAHLNQGARDLYVPDDPRHGDPWVHFLGVQAEWWFNSFTYR